MFIAKVWVQLILLNPNFRYKSNSFLVSFSIGGTIHLALGQGYPITGSVNTSAIHWDMICDMRDGGQIIVDGELFYESGEFKI
ncbi:MAG: hypothetical protein V3V66_00030 [Anaerolineales bacterium]